MRFRAGRDARDEVVRPEAYENVFALQKRAMTRFAGRTRKRCQGLQSG
jgi:hypothetical protein